MYVGPGLNCAIGMCGVGRNLIVFKLEWKLLSDQIAVVPRYKTAGTHGAWRAFALKNGGGREGWAVV